jgi:hypothetical protein
MTDPCENKEGNKIDNEDSNNAQDTNKETNGSPDKPKPQAIPCRMMDALIWNHAFSFIQLLTGDSPKKSEDSPVHCGSTEYDAQQRNKECQECRRIVFII